MEDYFRSNGMRMLVGYLNRLPATRVISTSEDDDNEAADIAAIIRQESSIAEDAAAGGRWWVKLTIDIRAHMAWHVVQELGHVLNFISLNERLPTVFKPTSAPPYLNGGPDAFLGWVIESTADDVDPGYVAEMLEGRLPKPVDDIGEWPRCEDGPCDVLRARNQRA